MSNIVDRYVANRNKRLSVASRQRSADVLSAQAKSAQQKATKPVTDEEIDARIRKLYPRRKV